MRDSRDGGSQSAGGTSQPPTDTSGDADVHAFLIADVRGYTAFTQEQGDEAAARLAGRFAEVTRSVVENHRGRVLEVRGDEALIVFGSPRSAIRGAVALQQRFVEETIADPSLPLTVGIGLDAGEAVAVEGGYRGGALNVAARLCSLARAGEVLASREIVHLALRVEGVRFTERGQTRLRGLDKPVHVVAVRSEERDHAMAIAPFVRSMPPTPRTRWKAVAAVAAFVVVAALVAIPLLTRDPVGDSKIEPDSVGILDPGSGEVVETVRLEERPGSVTASAGAVWVTNSDVGTVTRIDPDEQEIRDSIPVGESPTGIAIGFDAVWVVNSGAKSVSRISPDTNTVVGEAIEVGNGPAGIAAGEGAVWVTNRFDGTISRIDPDTGEIREEIPVGLDPRGIAIGFDSVWVALAGSNQVVRIDPTTNDVTHSIGVGNAPGSLAVSPDGVWVANTLDDTVMRISPETNSVVDTKEVGDGPSEIALVQGTVWVANEWDGTLSRVEPGQASARPMRIGSVPHGLAEVNGDLWVSVRGTATAHRGGTLRLAGLGRPHSLDPGNSYSTITWQVLHLIHDGLVAFEPIGANPRLVPDLATEVPTPTDGGRTYTFQLRRGIRYSNGELVAPADFLRAFERGWLLDPGDYPQLYGGLVGAEACGRRTCDLSEGIATDNSRGTITFHLIAPDPDFVYKLTIPFAYPVSPSVPDEERVAAGVPGTGPYMLETPMTDDGLTLVRNPNFRIWSRAARPDGYVDRIEWPFGVDPEAQVEAVAAGEADLAFDPEGASERLADLFVQSPAQVHTSPEPITFFAVLNNSIRPFDNVDVRRALNFALNRDRIVQIFGGAAAARPTCQQLPPNFPGYQPYCPYTLNPGPGGEGSWSGPDLEEAQRLVRRSGTAGTRVVVKVPTFLSGSVVRVGEYMIELLDELGFVGSMKRVPTYEEFYAPDPELQMALDAWGSDFPAASNFITNQFTCNASGNDPSAGFCDPRIDAMIDRATQTQLEDPAAAGALWAEVDRAIVDRAPYVWLVNPIAVEFVSGRVGNYQYSQQWSTLLDQLWVR